MSKWKTLEVAGEYRIDCPASATHRLEFDETAFVIRFPGSIGTDLWISRHAVDDKNPRLKATLRRLEHAVWRFLASSVTKAVGKAPGYSIEPAVDAGPYMMIVQGVGAVPGGDAWLARAVAKRGWHDFYFMHWNGPKGMMKETVIRSFVSFTPLC